jgi:3-phosphoshikimate 1-carboxyvinyltransferase
MQVIVQPSSVQGTIQANASKSAMQRACAAALLKKGTTIIHNPGISNDDLAALDIIQKLGAKVQHNDDGTLTIDSDGVQPIENHIHCGESGLSIRMFTPIAALSKEAITITGEGSLVTRPMDFFDEILPMLQVSCESSEGKLPLHIKGPVQPSDINIDGSLSSQFLTGLLMAYGASPNPSEGGVSEDQSSREVTITVENLKSKPYIDLTLELMRTFGLNVPENKDYKQFVFKPQLVSSSPQSGGGGASSYTVEGDWSGAAFLLVAGAVAGSVKVNGIFNTSRQADKKIVDAILDAGAQVLVEHDAVSVSKNELKAFVFDATDCPDLFPPLVALAANCKGISRIHGLRRLKHKESDRGVTLKEEMDKLGVRIDLNDDIMLVHGTGSLKVMNHTLNSHHDHRIAMANVIAALNADFEVSIRNAEAINKSYPAFYNHMQQLGVSLTEE